MFLAILKKLKLITGNDLLYYSLLFFCALLPFQFALNPSTDIDLAITRVFIPLLFLSWIFVSFKNKDVLLKRDKVTYLILFFLALAILSLLFSQNIGWSLRKLSFLFSIFPIYFIAVSILNTQDRTRKAIIALVGGASVLALTAILQFIAQFIFGIDSVYSFLADNITPFFLGNSFSKAVLSYPSWLVNAEGTTYMRATTIFPDPHMLSYYLGLLIPWSIILWSTSKKYSLWFFFSTVLLVIADISTFTRGAYVALIAGSLIILPIVSKTAVRKILLAIMALIILFTIAPHSPVASRLTSSFDVTEGSNQGRISNWQQATSIIKNNPLGVGIGMYSLAVNPKADYREPIYAHNLYLDIAAELGLAAMLIFIAILSLAFISFWRAAKSNPFFIAGVSSITIFAVHSLVETPLYSVHILSLICILLATSVGIKKYDKN